MARTGAGAGVRGDPRRTPCPACLQRAQARVLDRINGLRGVSLAGVDLVVACVSNRKGGRWPTAHGVACACCGETRVCTPARETATTTAAAGPASPNYQKKKLPHASRPPRPAAARAHPAPTHIRPTSNTALARSRPPSSPARRVSRMSVKSPRRPRNGTPAQGAARRGARVQRRALAWCAWIGAWFGAWCVASCGLLAGLLHGWFLLGTTTHYENEEEDLGLGRQIFIGFAPTAPGGNP